MKTWYTNRVESLTAQPWIIDGLILPSAPRTNHRRSGSVGPCPAWTRHAGDAYAAALTAALVALMLGASAGSPPLVAAPAFFLVAWAAENQIVLDVRILNECNVAARVADCVSARSSRHAVRTIQWPLHRMSGCSQT